MKSRADDKRAAKTTASRPVTTIAAPRADETRSSGSYADEAPFDRVQYLEAKLILKPDRFTSARSFREFGKIVRRTAKETAVGLIEDEGFRGKPQIREIIFLDTADFAFYRNAFILRRR